MKKTNKKAEELKKQFEELMNKTGNDSTFHYTETDELFDDEDCGEDCDETPSMRLVVRDPHTMMVPPEDGIILIGGDFFELNEDFELPVDLIIDFATMEKIYSYMKFRQAEINFKKMQF